MKPRCSAHINYKYDKNAEGRKKFSQLLQFVFYRITQIDFQ